MSLTPGELKTHIETALNITEGSTTRSLIGTYTLNNDAEIPAISIGNPINDIKVDGIEVIIALNPKVPRSYQGGAATHTVEHWIVTLVNHGQNKGDLFLAGRAMHDYFPRTKGDDVPQNSVTESLPMYVVTIIYGRGTDRLC